MTNVVHNWIRSTTVVAGFLGLMALPLPAAPLKSATVIQIGGNKEVVLAKEGAQERPAAVQDVIEGKDVLRTGKKSRAELEFADKSLARLGSNTVFSFDPASRDMNLQRGTALIHVPPGLTGARISTPAATAAIHGDVVAMRVNDKGATQIVALSKDALGPITVKFNKTGEERTLQAGQMLTIDPMAMKMPEPITIAVDVFVQSSPLLNGQGLEKKEMPDTARMEVKQTRDNQAKEIQNGNLESPHRVECDPTSVNQLAEQAVDTVASQVQSAAGNRLAGHYAGAAVNQSGVLRNITLDLREDGGFTWTTYTAGGIRVANGTYSTDGHFNASGNTGSHVTGQATFGKNTISGTRTVTTSGGGIIHDTYTATKQ